MAAFICLAGGLAATTSDVATWPAMTTVQRATMDPVQDSILGAAVAQGAFGDVPGLPHDPVGLDHGQHVGLGAVDRRPAWTSCSVESIRVGPR